MRHLFIATATTAALLATAALPDRAAAADVGPSSPPYGPPYTYGPPPGSGPPPAYSTSDEYGRPPAYGPPPGYDPPDDYGPPSDYGPPRRPPYAIPFAPSPPRFAVRPACDLQWLCGPWGCGWRRVCYPERYARPYRGYAPPSGPGYYGPY
jgi:hypothetical protein